MRLSKFILSNLEEILSEWESFASTVLPENKIPGRILLVQSLWMEMELWLVNA